MPTTNEGLEYLMKNGVIVGPAKAANAGGVACSAIEMSQNSRKYPMEREEVYEKLEGIMKHIHDVSAEASKEYGYGYNLVAGANIAGFLKVAEAMTMQGYV
jgi:glutamate dehydrogenase (NADP+)